MFGRGNCGCVSENFSCLFEEVSGNKFAPNFFFIFKKNLKEFVNFKDVEAIHRIVYEDNHKNMKSASNLT